MIQFWTGLIIIALAAALGWWGTQMAAEGWQKWMHPSKVSGTLESAADGHLSIGDTKQSRPPSASTQEKLGTESRTRRPSAEVPSLEKLFRSDFPNLLRSYSGRNLGIKDKSGEKTITIGEQLYLDFPGKSKFLGYYIPMLQEAYDICAFMADEYLTSIRDFESKVSVTRGHVAEFSQTSQKELVFTGRIYIYHESFFSHEQLANLEKLYQSKGLSVVFRGHAYLSSVWRPDEKFPQ